MSTRLPIPRALFDTLETLHEEVAACVTSYLAATTISQAEKEYQLTREFLKSYAQSPDTYTSYRREVERLVQWSWLIRKKAIKEINRNDIRDYLAFIKEPPLSWIATQNNPRFELKEGLKIHNLTWRPFVVRVSKARRHRGETPEKSAYQLSDKSMQALFAGLSTYFSFLQQE
jgi:hypothetical protein